MSDPNDPLSKKQRAKQKAALKKAKFADIDRMQEEKAETHKPKYPDDAKAQSKKKPSSYAKGGTVRGCGIARKGLTRGRMR